MKKISCDYCGKYLFTTDEKSLGVIAGKANTAGFVVKMPLFYGVGKFKIFCDKKCCKSWFQSNISKEDRDQGDKDVKEVFNEKTKEELKNGIASGLQAIQGLFREIRGMTEKERQETLRKLKVELEKRRNELRKSIQTQETTT